MPHAVPRERTMLFYLVCVVVATGLVFGSRTLGWLGGNAWGQFAITALVTVAAAVIFSDIPRVVWVYAVLVLCAAWGLETASFDGPVQTIKLIGIGIVAAATAMLVPHAWLPRLRRQAP